MLSVALTGNIASGKSTVADLFRRWGATIIDADELVREAQGPGQPVLSQIAARFGPGVLARDGSLNRAALRAVVLADQAALNDLNRIVHPEVFRRRAALLAEAHARGDRVVVSVIPLLFEVDDLTSFDAVILVDAPEPVRRARMVASRQLSTDEADGMMASQLSASIKRAKSDYVIDNDGDLATLERNAREVWRSVLTRA